MAQRAAKGLLAPAEQVGEAARLGEPVHGVLMQEPDVVLVAEG